MKKRNLLEKYGVPINHLDFSYIKTCQEAREMEKIVQILRSGQEGFYPDLTKCAEEKLRELKPNSKQFLVEEELYKTNKGSNTSKPILEFTENIKNADSTLMSVNKENCEFECVPLRVAATIHEEKKQDETAKNEKLTYGSNSSAIKKVPEAATDYRKWDKYDADVELLSIELSEEREKEELERKNNCLKAENNEIMIKPKEINSKILENLHKTATYVEREKLAEQARLRGNEYYRVKEYQKAISEYNLAIKIYPEKTTNAYNNRAIANMKLKNYTNAIDDCKEVLKQEPQNLKALLRYAQATQCSGNARESYDLFSNVLEIDSENSIALNAIADLQQKLGVFAPQNATRMQISDITNDVAKIPKVITNSSNNKKEENMNKNNSTHIENNKKVKIEKKIERQESQSTNIKEYDLAELVKPKYIVKSRLSAAAEAFKSLAIANSPIDSQKMKKFSTTENFSEPTLYLQDPVVQSKRKLIEEI